MRKLHLLRTCEMEDDPERPESVLEQQRDAVNDRVRLRRAQFPDLAHRDPVGDWHQHPARQHERCALRQAGRAAPAFLAESFLPL